MKSDVSVWSARRAVALGRLAGRLAPALFTVVFIGMVSVGMGMLAGGNGSSNHNIPWQFDVQPLQQPLDLYEQNRRYLDALQSSGHPLWRTPDVAIPLTVPVDDLSSPASPRDRASTWRESYSPARLPALPDIEAEFLPAGDLGSILAILGDPLALPVDLPAR